MNNGSTQSSSKLALMNKLLRRPMRSEREPNTDAADDEGNVADEGAPNACRALKLKVSGCCT